MLNSLTDKVVNLIHRLATDATYNRHWTEQSLKGGKAYSRDTVGAQWERFYEMAQADAKVHKKLFAK